MMFSLRNTTYITISVIILILGSLLFMGGRQYLLSREYDQIIEQGGKLVLRFGVIREQMIETLLEKQYHRLPEMAKDVETLHGELSDLLQNHSIPNEFKLDYMDQVDLPGFLLLVRQLPPELEDSKKIKELNNEARSLGNRLVLLERVMAEYAKRKLVGFQNVVIGVTVAVVLVLVTILVFWHRRIGMPVVRLGRQLEEMKLGQRQELTCSRRGRDTVKVTRLIDELLKADRGVIERFEKEKNDIKELVEEEELNRNLKQVFDLMVVFLSPAGSVVAMNSQGECLFGCKSHQVVGKNWITALLPVRQQKKWQKDFHMLLDSEGMEDCRIIEIISKDGLTRIFQCKLMEYSSSAGKNDQLVLVGREVGGLVRDDITVSQLKKERKRLLQQSDDMVFLLDDQGDIIEVNEVVLNRVNCNREQAIGENCCQLLDNHEKSPGDCFLSEVTKEHNHVIFEHEFARLDGRYLVSVSVVTNDVDKKRFLMVASKTFSETAKAQTVREAMIAMIENLAVGVNSEINELGNGISNYIQMMAEEIELSEQSGQEELAGKIISEGDKVTSMIRSEGQRVQQIVSQLLKAFG
jgi:PAS domain S-box-containing protein